MIRRREIRKGMKEHGYFETTQPVLLARVPMHTSPTQSKSKKLQ